MKNLLIVIFICFGQIIFAQTYIADKQEVSGTWSKKGSPYIIQGEAIVPANKTLKIKPGVEIKFKTGTSRDYRIDGKINNGFDVGFLRVYGKVVAKGKVNSLITFTRDGSYGNWGNICFVPGSKNNYLKYCKVEGSYYVRSILPTDNATGAVTFINASGTVENCLLVNNGWTGLNCKQMANPTVKNTTIFGNNYGVECNSNGNPFLSGVIIWNNENAFYNNNSEAAPSIEYSLLQDDYFPENFTDKGNNIAGKNPQFNSERNKDFSLKSNSPCIKAGKGKSNIGAL